MERKNVDMIALVSFIASIALLIIWLVLDLADRFYYSPLLLATRGYREYLFIAGILLGLASTFLRKRG